MPSSLQLQGLHTRFPYPSLSPRVCSNSCPLSQWCHPTISSSADPFSCPQSFPASEPRPMSWLFSSGVQSIGASASASVFTMNIQGWFPLGLTFDLLESPRNSQGFLSKRLMLQMCVSFHVYGDGHCNALIASLGIWIKVAARKTKNKGGEKRKKIFSKFYSILQSSQTLWLSHLSHAQLIIFDIYRVACKMKTQKA